MKLGDGHSWMDVEGDEATFARTHEDTGDRSKPIRWEQWLGLVERGRPDMEIGLTNAQDILQRLGKALEKQGG